MRKTTTSKTVFAVEGSASLAHPQQDAIEGYANVTVVDDPTLETPWTLSAIDGKTGTVTEAAGEAAAPSSGSRASSSESYAAIGQATLDGFGQVGTVSGFRKVTLAGRDGDHALTVSEAVTTWRQDGETLFSARGKASESSGDGTVSTATTLERKALGESLKANHASVKAIAGYRDVELVQVAVGEGIAGGDWAEEQSSRQSGCEDVGGSGELQASDPECGVAVEVQASQTTSVSKGRLTLAEGTCVQGTVSGFMNVVVSASEAESVVGGRMATTSRTETETTAWCDMESSDDESTVSVEKRSLGSLTVTDGGVLTGKASGFERVTLVCGTVGDVSWAVEDDLLGTLNGKAVQVNGKDSSGLHFMRMDAAISGDDDGAAWVCEEPMLETQKDDLSVTVKVGGTFKAVSSQAGAVCGFKTVTLASSETGGVTRDTLVKREKRKVYYSGRLAPVYAGSGDATTGGSLMSYFSGPDSITRRAQGTAAIVDSVVNGGIAGYGTVMAKTSSKDSAVRTAIHGNITGGSSRLEGKVTKTTLVGRLTMTDVSLDGDIEGFTTVTLKGVTAETTDIRCGKSTVTAGFARDFQTVALSGTVRISQSKVGGAVVNAQTVNATEAQLGDICVAVGDDGGATGRGRVTLKDSVVSGGVSGYAFLTLQGDVTIEGTVTGTGGADAVTIGRGAFVTFGGGCSLGDGRDALRISSNGVLKVRGVLELGGSSGQDRLVNNGDLILLADESGNCTAPETLAALQGSGTVFADDAFFDACDAQSSLSFNGVRKIGSTDVAAWFAGSEREALDDSLDDPAVDLLDWLGEERTNTGWLCGCENVYHLLGTPSVQLLDAQDDTTGVAISGWNGNSRTSDSLWIDSMQGGSYFIDKDDCFSLDVAEALDNGITALDFSGNANVYMFGDRWFDILSKDGHWDLQAVADEHAGDLNVAICVTVSGELFKNAGTYTIACS